MKKSLLFSLFIIISISLMAQMKKPVAVDDTVYFNNGETITFNPILNDYDTQGVELKMVEVYGFDDLQYFSFNDSTITFKVADLYLGEQIKLTYVLDYESSVPYDWGDIYLIPVMPIIDTLEVNQISTPIYPMNIQFFDAYYTGYGPQFMYPTGSTSSTIFSSALWIGGKTADNELHLAGERYKQFGSDFWPGPLSDDGFAATDSINAAHWLRTWKVNREEVNDHMSRFNDPDYVMPEAIENWPAHGDPALNQAEYIAPFVDVDQDLEYHPELGDYPFIKGDQSVFFIYNDQLTHTETQGSALGLEIHCMAWALDEVRDGNPYNSTVFYSYKIFNKSMEDYYDTYLGVFTDIDLGFASDDYIGCHVENGNFYAYNGTEIDGNGEPESFGENIPSQSVCILGGPFIDPDNSDNPTGICDESINGAGFGDGEIDNERYGMNRFIYFNNGGASYMSDPQEAPEYYDLMRGIWKDGSAMLYGGNGHSTSGGDPLFPTRFMFPGDSDPCNWGTNGVNPGSLWTEEIAGNQPADKRGLASMGPFTFEAGTVEYLDIAYVTAPATADKDSKELVQDYIAQIKQDYLIDPLNFGNQYVGLEEGKEKQSLLEVYPNPIDGDYVHFDLDGVEQAHYQIYSTTGQLVKSGELNQEEIHSLFVGDLNSGWYILEIRSGAQIYRSKLIK